MQSNSSTTYGRGERVTSGNKRGPHLGTRVWGAGGKGEAMASALQTSQ